MEVVNQKSNTYVEDYKKYYPKIMKILILKTGHREDAEDICQEIFYTYYKNMDKVENTRLWLNGVLRYYLRSYYRSRNEMILDIDMTELIDQKPAFASSENEVKVVISEYICHKNNFRNDKERKAFTLIMQKGYSHTAAAQRLGLTIRQISYNFHQTIRRIRYNLQYLGLYSVDDII